MFYILRRNRPVTVKAEGAEALPEGRKPQASAAAVSEEPEIRQSKLFYVRRFGPIMGVCLYELDASLRVSAGSAGSVGYPPHEPFIER